MDTAWTCSNWKKLLTIGLLAFSIICFDVMTTSQISWYQRRLCKPDGVAFDIRMEPAEKMVARVGNTVLAQNCSCSSNIDEPLLIDLHETEPDQISSGPTHGLIVSSKDKSTMKDSLTGTLWDFKQMEDEKLYLYESVLKRWSSNVTNARKFRDELARYGREFNGNYFMLHQKNVKVKQVIDFIFKEGKTKSTAITPTFYSLLPKKSPFPASHRFNSCAVVGNSGLLKSSNCGTTIDRNDFVFRCNMAPLEPFKSDAGAKSNITTVNPSLIQRQYDALTHHSDVIGFRKDLSHYNGFIWIPCLGLARSFPISYKAVESSPEQNPKVVCGHPAHFKRAGGLWAKKIKRRISTGFYLVTSAIQMCDEVNLFGFWPFSSRFSDNGMTKLPYHYYDNSSSARATMDHSMSKEFSILLQLHNMGVVHLHANSC